MRLLITIAGILLIGAAIIPPSPQQQHRERCIKPLLQLASTLVDSHLHGSDISSLLVESEMLQFTLLKDISLEDKTKRCMAFVERWQGG